jgi:hypothetical protein
MSDVTAVREEDRFDVEAMHAWLRPFIQIDELPEVLQFRSGASNLTYLLNTLGASLYFVDRLLEQKQHLLTI